MSNSEMKEATAKNSLLRIDSMELRSFRNFSRVEIDFDPFLTVLVAQNGCGKTAALDALSVALGPFVGAFDIARGVHFLPSDVRRIPKSGTTILELEPQYPLSQQMQGLIGGKPSGWGRALKKAKSRTTYGDARNLIEFGKRLQEQVREAAAHKADDPILPIVSYYGTGRLWSEKRFRSVKKTDAETSRTAGYGDCLDSASHYKAFVDWFERLCRAEWEERDNAVAMSKIRASLSAMRDAVDCMLKPSGWHGIAYKSSKAGIVAQHDAHGEIPVDWLSDGIRNMIGLAADIAHRAVRLNSHLGREAVIKTPGVVLIDEVDMHLHPEWQQTVVADLRRAFPLMQFVVTTHSPQALTAIRKEHIRLLAADGSVEKLTGDDIGTYGAESSRVLQEVFGVHSRPQGVETVQKLRDYLDMVESRREETDDAKSLRRELEAALGAEDPDLKLADIRISQLKVLNSYADHNEKQ